MDETLWVIMPAYNEEECVGRVLDEWVPMLRKMGVPFKALVLNDGSKDHTSQVLAQYAQKYREVIAFDKPNSGHGQSCLEGYCMALTGGAHWVLQIDSDGQCDAKYFKNFWNARKQHDVVFGLRVIRGDGAARWLISRIVSLVSFLSTGAWLIDANVPYRLMKRNVLERAIQNIPQDFYLVNILISVRLKKLGPIKWIPIYFRDRIGGSPSIKTFSFVKHGAKLFRQLFHYGKLPPPVETSASDFDTSDQRSSYNRRTSQM